MNPIMFRGDEYKGHYQEVLREVALRGMEHERSFGKNSIIKVWSGLGGMIIGLIVAGLWFG